MAKVPGVCAVCDDSPATAEHHLLQANGDLLLAMEPGDPRIVDGALLHALDELQELSDLLGIEGFKHPDGG